MDAADERMHILQMIEDGQISASEGLRLIETLPKEAADDAPLPPADASAAAGSEPPGAEPAPGLGAGSVAEKPAPPANLPHWQRWWLIPMWVGIGITTLGAWLMYLAFGAHHTFSAWFWLAALLVFAPGIVVMVLAAASRHARWLHIRVKNRRQGENFALSFPIPIRPAAWFLRTFGSHIPRLKNTGVDELVMAMGDTTTSENPLYVAVDDDEDGEQVEVYIG